ncbi:hypothetical protein MUY14_26020 [Amycolatopsis sp. FBCC-B4732]|uniref:hypothetical protein n=1 Tax=Amycolatopsis sp. FBCC-B4732 TaxID=3079339 RepID=UPI001FF2D7E1|nr:hypothetical protein [Amycolatopsis sp. FBCC-B4732]UOX85249.1 hypothetical protein MUY14_26020 [Amycolatopsis sp. FBCC-B4732]
MTRTDGSSGPGIGGNCASGREQAAKVTAWTEAGEDDGTALIADADADAEAVHHVVV